MLVTARKVEYPRRTIPHNAQGDWYAIAYFDGSEQAFSCVIYAVWQIKNGGADVKFLASKAKVAPDWSKNTPRKELCGAVLATRVAVQRLVLIVPYEEQQQWPSVTNDVKDVAQNIIEEANMNRYHEADKVCHEIQKVKSKHIVTSMLKTKGQFDDTMAKLFENSWSSVQLQEGGTSVGEYRDLTMHATDAEVLGVRDLVERSYIFNLSREF